MTTDDEPWHAHVYAREGDRVAAEALHAQFVRALAAGEIVALRFVGDLAHAPVGPHPLPQFEVHFLGAARTRVCAVIEASGLTALIHPLTDDDLADHTRLAQWIGEPLTLDLSVLDPPGLNQVVTRFGRSDL